MRSWMIGRMVGLAGLVLGTSAGAAVQYTVRDLTVESGLNGGGSINNAGQIASSIWTGALDEFGWPISHAVIWENGAVLDIHGTGPGSSYAADINSSGQVVGDFVSSTFYPTGFFYDYGSLGLYEPGSRNWAVNDRGQIAGEVDWASHRPVLREGAAAAPLPVLSAYGASPYAINNHGQIVGWAYTPKADFHACLWQDGAILDLDGTSTKPTGWNLREAVAINDAGQVAGTASLPDGSFRAFLWHDGIVDDLGTQMRSSYAYDINARGQIVGGMAPIEPSELNRAVLWEDGELLDLNDFIAPGTGLTLTGAGSINDAGVIVASGYVNGTEHVVLLTPVPDPGTFAIGVAGLCVCLYRKRF